MTTITKERLLTIKQWRETYGPGSNVVLPAEEAEELARIALASLEAEPVAWTDEEELRDVRKYGFGEIFQCPPDKYADPRRVISLYRELPAPVVPDDWQLVPKKITLEMECALSKADSYEIGWLWALAAAPKYEVQNAKRVQNALNACHAAMLQGSQPVSQTYNLPELIEGMEVSIDVSTCDADLGNRYFGTVTEALELDTAKNGYILLVQDAEPNFDVNGNSPGTPDSWISCSDRMPEKGQNVLISVNFDSSLVEPLICSARYTGSTFRRGDATIKPGNGIEQATHWMPLPEPPQEAK